MEPSTDYGNGLRRYLERNPSWRPDVAATQLSVELLFALFVEAETDPAATQPRFAPALA